MWRYKARELAHIWVDYIRALFDELDNEHMLMTLSRNSNFFTVDFFGFQLIVDLLPIASEKFHKFYQIRYNSISVWFIGIDGKKNGNVTPKNFLEITGQGLALFWVDVFYFLMEKFWFTFLRYKRIDFAMDLFMHMHYFYEKILMDKFKKEKTYTPFIKKWECETIYFWEKSLEKNNYQLVRIYNKIIDSIKKEKLFLFYDRKDEKWNYRDVTRFEVEIREDLAKYYDFYDIANPNIFFAKINKTFFKYNKQFFKFIDFSDFHEYEKKIEEEKKIRKQNMKNIKAWLDVKPQSLHQEKVLKKMKEMENQTRFWRSFLDEKEEKDAIKMFLSWWKKLYRNGYPIPHLLDILEWWISDGIALTKQDLFMQYAEDIVKDEDTPLPYLYEILGKNEKLKKKK